ncbi:MAG: 2-C-methyl-D-erythritol 4-phosphate cytidylyltransferase [Pyrinomonadaceae bacterium]|jgi:2-C-methyl-D-erythritol 4-phosphate cytidylyltransferase|nr:2-C-methyl-D-erythritol 4-phosphate cytidylyltransferase [Pyrinomonadaceae bacterium]
MNTAIIVAAGSGTRFGSDEPKQFLEILGKPLLLHTLEQFENCPIIDEIILVLSAEYVEIFQAKHISKLQKIVLGGKNRAESVLNGLNSVNPKTEIVAIHDGARPLVSVREISQTIEKAKIFGACCLVANVTDTIKEISNDGEILQTIDRSKLRRALTPQTFKIDIIKRAFAENEVSEIATDECYLVEKLGVKISTVEGSSKNIKVTTKEDLIFVENFLSKTNN